MTVKKKKKKERVRTTNAQLPKKKKETHLSSMCIRKEQTENKNKTRRTESSSPESFFPRLKRSGLPDLRDKMPHCLTQGADEGGSN